MATDDVFPEPAGPNKSEAIGIFWGPSFGIKLNRLLLPRFHSTCFVFSRYFFLNELDSYII